jgi:FixJ family two-component response regulator
MPRCRLRRGGISPVVFTQAAGMVMTIDQPIIFVVDDKASVRDALAQMLRVFGYTVATYATAESFFYP